MMFMLIFAEQPGFDAVAFAVLYERFEAPNVIMSWVSVGSMRIETEELEGNSSMAKVPDVAYDQHVASAERHRLQTLAAVAVIDANDLRALPCP
jgi:hypothetical protein